MKLKYEAKEYEDTSPKSHLYKILKKVDSGNFLTEQDVNFLKKRNLTETMKIVNDKYAFFLETKIKKLEVNLDFFVDANIQWLQNNGYKHIVKIANNKYASFLETKIGNLDFFVDANIQWLQNNGYEHIINIAKEEYAEKLKSKVASPDLLKDAEEEIVWLKSNGYQDIIILMDKKLFADLRSKYNVSTNKNISLSSPLYPILQKFEQANRIEPKDVAWLQENHIFDHRIKTKYHSIEADFYQQEFKRTGNKWNLVNASSHFRKAEKSNLALQITNNLPLKKISDDKLKSALLTTRGGAFRDVSKLDSAENCARQAMKFQPNSHHPYTLMGAICFERHQYTDGEYWFN